MQLVSFFSGIGGFELASRWMGWDNVFSCEINPFGQRVLKHHFPEAYHHDDIKTFTIETLKKSRWNPLADTIVCGGFPCQPYSSAGQRKGTADDRHLWPEMLRAIREISPRWVVGENVRGLTNWNGGLVFDQVQADLETEGFEVLPFLLPACAVNAPHRRDRIWFIAHSDGTKQGNNSRGNNSEETTIRRRETGDVSEQPVSDGVIADTLSDGRQKLTGGMGQEAGENGGETRGNVFDALESDGKEGTTTDSERRKRRKGNPQERTQPIDEQFEGSHIPFRRYWQIFPTQSPVYNGNDGFPAELDGITFPQWRVESIKAGGNAIVPQVALQIFKAIQGCPMKPSPGKYVDNER